MGCGSSKARATTPIMAGNNSRPNSSQNGRFDSAPVNAQQGEYSAMHLVGACTILILMQNICNSPIAAEEYKLRKLKLRET